jgi:hypothetical protein
MLAYSGLSYAGMIFCITFLGHQLAAQDFKYRKLKVGFNFVNQPDGAGTVFNFQPSYKIINDNIQVGLRMEWLIGTASIGCNGQYYLSRAAGIRPYLGLGFSEFLFYASPKYGFYPRLGFDLGHSNFNIDINIVNGHSFIGYGFGFFIGGGKKKIEKKVK